MKVEKRDGTKERRILIGMIVDKAALSRITANWEPGLFSSRWANLIGKWCVDFYEKYERAPQSAIEGIFEAWASKHKDKDTIKLVEKFLDALSGEYQSLRKESNSEYTIDLAAKHFNEVKLRKLADSVRGDLDSGDADKATNRIETFHRVEMGVGAGIDVLRDQGAIREAFERTANALITYPDPLDHFFDGLLERDALIGFMGPEKRGKSFWLLDIAWRGMLQRRKVAYFEVGDLSQSQAMNRFMVRAAKHPFKLKGGFPGVVRYPKQITKEQGAEVAQVVFKEKQFKARLDWRTAWRASERIIQTKLKTRNALLRLSSHPNSSINVAGIRSILQSWERDDWTPDIIVIDYADILAPPAGSKELRDQINSTWQQLRALSQTYHCLVVTATQTDASSYYVHTLTRSNFSDDKRKFAHVNAMFGINQTIEEKESQIQRLNKLAVREGEFNERHCIHIAGSLSIANPAICATY